MKIILLFTFIIQCSFAKDEYVVPKDIIEIRDRIVLKNERFKNKMLQRYIDLSKKKELSIAEEREYYALSSIISNKDSRKAEETLMKIYQKDDSKSKIMEQ